MALNTTSPAVRIHPADLGAEQILRHAAGGDGPALRPGRPLHRAGPAAALEGGCADLRPLRRRGIFFLPASGRWTGCRTRADQPSRGRPASARPPSAGWARGGECGPCQMARLPSRGRQGGALRPHQCVSIDAEQLSSRWRGPHLQQRPADPGPAEILHSSRATTCRAPGAGRRYGQHHDALGVSRRSGRTAAAPPEHVQHRAGDALAFTARDQSASTIACRGRNSAARRRASSAPSRRRP
jgi:hypothetical protein